MFFFNSKKFDFWQIYDCIKHYYPLGIKKEESGFFYTNPGINELRVLIYNKIVDTDEYAKWERFLAEVEQTLKKTAVDNTAGQVPCYSGYVEIGRFSHENHTRTKELHFHVSILGPFYTIIGLDNNTVTIDWMTFRNPTYMVISPQGEYSDDFILLQSLIETRFEGYRFVPYDIYHQVIDRLEIHYNEGDYNTVVNGIFNTQVNFRIQKIGDEFYNYEQWLKK